MPARRRTTQHHTCEQHHSSVGARTQPGKRDGQWSSFLAVYQDLAFCTCRHSTTWRHLTAPAKTSHKMACSARLRGTSFKSALPGKADRKAYLEWSGQRR